MYYKLGDEEPFEAILGILGLFKLNPMSQEDLLSTLSHIFRLTAALFITMGSLMHFVKIVQEDVTEIDKSEDFTTFLGFTSIYIVGLFFLKFRSDWAAMVRNIMDFEVYGSPKSIRPIARRTNLLAKLWFWYGLLGVFVYGAVAKRNSGSCRQVNQRRNLNLICGTLVPLHVSFYEIPAELRPMVFWVQGICIIYLMSPAALICFLSYETTQVLSAHMEHLRGLFDEIVDDGDARKIGFWVRYHLHILELATQLNELFKTTFNAVPLLSAVVIACCENQVIRTQSLGIAMFLVGYLVSVMLVCHAGQQVQSDSLRIADAIRDSEWYKADARFQRNVVFLLMRAQKPIIFHTLPIGTLNYSFFVMVVRASYSYMTLLNQSI